MGFGDRYFFLFKLAFWLLSFELARGAWAGRRGHLGVAVAALLLAVAAAQPERLRRAPLADKQWRQAIAPALAGESAEVAINPSPWTITVHPESPSE